MAKRIEAIVKPELLVWARESAGLSVQGAAGKVRVKPERLRSWEAGEGRPTVVQLRKLGNVYRRPLAVFFLPKPPKRFQAMRDFRRLPGDLAGTESPQLRYEIRQAHFRRDVALDLYSGIDELPPELAVSASSSDDPESVAGGIRHLLGVTYEEQLEWKTPYAALNRWRSALEDLGVFVFQVSGIDVSEMRGFSISERPLPVIAVNIRDAPRARVFTMLHEFTHIGLQEGGLCDLREEGWLPPEEHRVEFFCNWVAGAVIVPLEQLLGERIVVAKRGDLEWSDEELAILVRRYNASYEVVLRRLLIAGCTSEEFYRMKREEWQQYYESRPRSSHGFASPSTMAVSSAGHRFVELVLNSYYQERITTSDLSDLLGVRLKHMPTIEEKVLGHAVEFGVVA